MFAGGNLIVAPQHSMRSIGQDLISGTVVFLVALPLCLGIALGSGAPLFSGILAGVVGGIVVGWLSGSHTSVTGPAAGLTAIVATQITALGSFERFLTALLIAGLIQIVLGLARLGFIAAFFPSSVIRGLLAAIGVMLILSQTPYLLGIFGEGVRLWETAHWHPGAILLGAVSIALLWAWDRTPWLKRSIIPAPLVVVLLGVLGHFLLQRLAGRWELAAEHLVAVPAADSFSALLGLLEFPDFSVVTSGGIYVAAITIAIVASLETLLNLEAVDKLDPRRRLSPPSRELFAQGVGNTLCGLIGGLPLTSVVIRGSVNINAGATSKASAIFHGILLAAAVIFLPQYLNLIPLSSLAAILIVTGFKLASPGLIQGMYRQGRYQFIPFVVTLVAIVLADLLIGIAIGLGVSLLFILNSNYRRPLRMIIEKHLSGDVHRVELAHQVSFLNRAALERVFRSVPSGGHLFIDAEETDYIDPDILALIRDYIDNTAPANGVSISVRGLHEHYRQLPDDIRYVDHSTQELQRLLQPGQVLEILREGNRRFASGQSLQRDTRRQVVRTARSHYPMAVVMSCIDARTPARMLMDVGLGDVLNVRLASSVLVGPRVLASVEYGCAVGGAKLVVVLGNTDSPVIRSAVEAVCAGSTVGQGTHFTSIIEAVRPSIPAELCQQYARLDPQQQDEAIDAVSQQHVRRSIPLMLAASETLAKLVADGQLGMIAAIYDTHSGVITFLEDSAVGIGG